MDNKKIFDKKYFAGYYFDITGNFTKKDLRRNKNWFHGWFDVLQDWYDFSSGRGRKTLEIGCAIGAASAILQERGFDVLATDISRYAIQKAKQVLPQLSFAILDIEQPVRRTSTYDLIFSFEVLEHLEKPEVALRHMYQMLKPDGVTINSTPFPYAYVARDITHINVKYPHEWVRLYKHAGFSRVKYKHIGFLPFFYRFSPSFHLQFPFGLPTKYINSSIFLYGEKK